MVIVEVAKDFRGQLESLVKQAIEFLKTDSAGDPYNTRAPNAEVESAEAVRLARRNVSKCTDLSSLISGIGRHSLDDEFSNVIDLFFGRHIPTRLSSVSTNLEHANAHPFTEMISQLELVANDLGLMQMYLSGAKTRKVEKFLSRLLQPEQSTTLTVDLPKFCTRRGAELLLDLSTNKTKEALARATESDSDVRAGRGPHNRYLYLTAELCELCEDLGYRILSQVDTAFAENSEYFCSAVSTPS